MLSEFLRWRCCQWLALGVVSATLAGCAPTPDTSTDTGDVKNSARAVLAAPRKPVPAPKPASVSEPLRPDAYSSSHYRDKGLGIKANKPVDTEQSETPEDTNKYELNPPSRESDQQGKASWYGEQFHGRKTASGERFDLNEFTAAHRSLPFGTRVCVRSSVTGKSVVVRINDRGPFAPGRIIDLSKAAAQELGMLGLGIKPVELWQLEADEDECPARVSAKGKKSGRAVSASASKSTRATAKSALAGKSRKAATARKKHK